MLRVPNSSAKLAATALALLAFASLIGTFKFALGLNHPWPEFHSAASRFFGITGLYLLTLAWFDSSGILRVRLPYTWVHLADGILIFALSRWLSIEATVQLFIGVAMSCAAFLAAWRFYMSQLHRRSSAIGVSAVLFLVNGLWIGGSETPLVGAIYRIDVFHIGLAAWALSISWIFKQAPCPTAKWSVL